MIDPPLLFQPFLTTLGHIVLVASLLVVGMSATSLGLLGLLKRFPPLLGAFSLLLGVGLVVLSIQTAAVGPFAGLGWLAAPLCLFFVVGSADRRVR